MTKSLRLARGPLWYCSARAGVIANWRGHAILNGKQGTNGQRAARFTGQATLANPLAYPINPAPRIVEAPVTLSADKLASWKRAGITASVCADEHVVLFDASGKALKANAPASTATYAIWVNVATRFGADGVLATMIRGAAGKRGEVKMPSSDEARASFVGKLADGLATMVAPKGKRAPKATPVAQATVETPVEEQATVQG